jgi:hypothetical protein
MVRTTTEADGETPAESPPTFDDVLATVDDLAEGDKIRVRYAHKTRHTLSEPDTTTTFEAYVTVADVTFEDDRTRFRLETQANDPDGEYVGAKHRIKSGGVNKTRSNPVFVSKSTGPSVRHFQQLGRVDAIEVVVTDGGRPTFSTEPPEPDDHEQKRAVIPRVNDAVTIEEGDTVAVDADGDVRHGTFVRKTTTNVSNKFAKVTMYRVHFDTDDGGFVVEYREEYEPSNRNYPGYHGFTHPTVDGEPVDDISRLATDGGRPPRDSFDHAPDVGPSDVDKCRECGRYAPHAFDHAPECSRFESIDDELSSRTAASNSRMVRPATDGGDTKFDKPPERPEQIASSIVAAQEGDRVAVWCGSDGDDDTLSIFEGTVASTGYRDDTDGPGGTHVVAIDVAGDRVAVHFDRVIDDDWELATPEPVLFDPVKGARLPVTRFEGVDG